MLRPSVAGLEEVMSNGLCHVISHESARDVGSFWLVFRVRTRDAEEYARPDKEVSDED